MVKFISQDIIDQINDSLNIVDVVGDYVRLEKAGKNFKALCPFHYEKTPSFVVSPEKQIYHCFGCNEGGNMFSFVMKYSKLEFPEAVKKLAEKAGITIPDNNKFSKSSKSKILYQINKEAANRFYKLLMVNKKAEKYFFKRGIDLETVKYFGLGYAEDKWDSMLIYLKSKGFNGKDIQRTGLILSGKKNGYYDRFRDRVIFPILDVSSRIAGFGARTLKNEIPKYVNSPETEIYSKRKILYGLNFSKEHIRKQDYAVIVEGYTDFITLFKNGIKNVVSNLGTSLTIEHIRLLKRFTDNFIMVYDSDEAGKNASLRNLDLAVENNVRVKIACLPSGDDPDSFVFEKGKDEFMKFIHAAKDLVDYKLEVLNYKNESLDLHAKKRIIEDILSTVAKIESPILRDEYLNRLSDLSAVGIKEQTLRQSLSIIMNKQQSRNKNFVSDFNIKEDTAGSNIDIPALEKLLLRAMFESDDAVSCVKDKLNIEDFRHPLSKKIAENVFNTKEFKTCGPDKIMKYFDDQECCKLLAKLFYEYKNMPKHMTVLEDCIKKIEMEKLNLKLNDLKLKIKKADVKGKRDLLFSYNNLCRKITDLKKVKNRG